MPYINSGGGGGPPHVSPGTYIQTGANSPLNVVTPSQKGSLYQDTTNGALYVAVGATSADWVTVGGYTPGAIGAGGAHGATTGSDGALYLTSKAGLGTFISDGAALSTGSANGFYWNFDEVADGSQNAALLLGPASDFRHVWAADGTYTLPVLATGPTHAPRLSQLSPKATITSGALPTQAFVSGAGAQVSTTRDVETVTPVTGDGTNNAATCAVALSPDNVTYSTLDTLSIAAALNLTGVIALAASVRVPAGWYLKLTASHATIGTTTYY